MTPRYTVRALEADVKKINETLFAAEAIRHWLEINQSYGRTQIDLYRMRDGKPSCERRLESGTPRECLSACYAYLSGVLQIAVTDTWVTILHALTDGNPISSATVECKFCGTRYYHLQSVCSNEECNHTKARALLARQETPHAKN